MSSDNKQWWMIHFEDDALPNEYFDNEDIARRRFGQALLNWNCTLFCSVPEACRRITCICGVSFLDNDAEMLKFHADCPKQRFINDRCPRCKSTEHYHVCGVAQLSPTTAKLHNYSHCFYCGWEVLPTHAECLQCRKSLINVAQPEPFGFSENLPVIPDEKAVAQPEAPAAKGVTRLPATTFDDICRQMREIGDEIGEENGVMLHYMAEQIAAKIARLSAVPPSAAPSRIRYLTPAQQIREIAKELHGFVGEDIALKLEAVARGLEVSSAAPSVEAREFLEELGYVVEQHPERLAELERFGLCISSAKDAQIAALNNTNAVFAETIQQQNEECNVLVERAERAEAENRKLREATIEECARIASESNSQYYRPANIGSRIATRIRALLSPAAEGEKGAKK